MSDHPPPKKEPPSPGTVFGYLLAVAVGGMLVVTLAINSVGESQLRYPHVWSGLVTLVILVALFLALREKKDGGGGGDHH